MNVLNFSLVKCVTWKSQQNLHALKEPEMYISDAWNPGCIFGINSFQTFNPTPSRAKAMLQSKQTTRENTKAGTRKITKLVIQRSKNWIYWHNSEKSSICTYTYSCIFMKKLYCKAARILQRENPSASATKTTTMTRTAKMWWKSYRLFL